MRRLHPHVGNRGSCLMAFAALDFVYATYLVTSSGSTQKWFNAVVPIACWAAAWAAVGALCLISAFRENDMIGYTAAIGIKVIWGLGCLIGWAMSDVTLGSVGIWLGFAWLVWRISGWPEAAPIGEDQGRDS